MLNVSDTTLKELTLKSDIQIMPLTGVVFGQIFSGKVHAMPGCIQTRINQEQSLDKMLAMSMDQPSDDAGAVHSRCCRHREKDMPKIKNAILV